MPFVNMALRQKNTCGDSDAETGNFLNITECSVTSSFLGYICSSEKINATLLI